MLDTLIKNAQIIDGSGQPRYTGSVGIRDGKLVLCGADAPAREVIDARGRVLCPGFIDAHSHGDRPLGTVNTQTFKTGQGITTEITGHCGVSVAPVTEKNLASKLPLRGIGYTEEEIRSWHTYANYLDSVSRRNKTTNVKFLVGHNVLRSAVMGTANRRATKEELDSMCSILREAMQAGAAGLSTGLVYVPGVYADTAEVVALARVAAEYGGMYTSHIRNESHAVVSAVDEAIDIGRQSGARVCISHHKVMGVANRGKHLETLAMIERANREGVYVTCDQYPYTRNATGLDVCMPPEYFSDGKSALSARLSDRALREEIKEKMNDPDVKYENFYLSAGGWDGVYITNLPVTKQAQGKTMTEYARELGMDVFDAYFDLMIQNNCSGNGVFDTMSEESLCDIISSPYCVVGTDDIPRRLDEIGHPRVCSSFPRAISLYVEKHKLFPLEKMIHKMTGLPAERLLVPNKGLIRDGYDADLLLLDMENFRDNATFDQPNLRADGIDLVIVNGKTVYRDKQLTGVYSGRIIYHKA